MKRAFAWLNRPGVDEWDGVLYAAGAVLACICAALAVVTYAFTGRAWL